MFSQTVTTKGYVYMYIYIYVYTRQRRGGEHAVILILLRWASSVAALPDMRYTPRPYMPYASFQAQALEHIGVQGFLFSSDPGKTRGLGFEWLCTGFRVPGSNDLSRLETRKTM